MRPVFTRTFKFLTLLCLSLAFSISVDAAGARIKKVLPHFIDAKGRNSLAPSLYERDAYQFFLRNNPAKRAGLRFDVKWSGGSKSENLRLRVEMRGAQADNIRIETLELPVKKTGWFSRWSSLTLRDDTYKTFGDLIAWRVSLWENDAQLAEQKSFLW